MEKNYNKNRTLSNGNHPVWKILAILFVLFMIYTIVNDPAGFISGLKDALSLNS